MNRRILSLDVLRGLTVIMMIIVNNVDALPHSDWNGLLLADLVFPFFIFIMGISTSISTRRCKPRINGAHYAIKIVRRTLLLLVIGWILNWFEGLKWADIQALNFSDSAYRLTGVLPRIAICYIITAIVAIICKPKHIIYIVGALIVGYTAMLYMGNGFANDETNILAVVDRNLLGIEHLYTKKPIDPEGLLSTISAVAHALIGFLVGKLMFTHNKLEKRVLRLFIVCFTLFAIGWLCSDLLPLNKRIWSPTFLLVTCGACGQTLASLMYVIDHKGIKAWSKPFAFVGRHSLVIYVLAETIQKCLHFFL